MQAHEPAAAQLHVRDAVLAQHDAVPQERRTVFFACNFRWGEGDTVRKILRTRRRQGFANPKEGDKEPCWALAHPPF